MNEARLRRLLQRVVLSAAALPVSTTGCGGKDESSTTITPHPEVVSVTDAGMSNDVTGMLADDAPLADAATNGSGPFMYCTSSRTVIVDASTEPFLQMEGGILANPECEPFCGPAAGPLNLLCTLPDPMQPSLVECLVCGFGGRLPEGLIGTGTTLRSDVAGHFVEMAHLEAASIEAFRILCHELQHHRAPKQLVRAARRAACDEVRHSRAVAALARRYGGAPRTPCVEKRSLRSLEAIALDNAVEGCVRETYGAAVAM